MHRIVDLHPFDAIRLLDKRRREHRHVGWVYIMRNPAFREPLLKIGKSRRPPTLRAEELGTATAVPEGFQIVYFVHVSNHHEAEARVHQTLGPFRKTLGKEFFSAPLSEAIRALDQVAEFYPVLIGSGKYRQVLPQLFGAVTVTCSRCGLDNRVRQLAVTVLAKCSGCQAPLST